MVGIFVDHPQWGNDFSERDPGIPLREIFVDRRRKEEGTIDTSVLEHQYEWYLNYVLVRSEN